MNSTSICVCWDGVCFWHAPKFFNGLKCELETTEEQGAGAHSLVRSTLGVEGHARPPRWDQEEWQSSTTHTDLHKTNTRRLVHSWNTFSVRTNHGQIRTHKTHHILDLGEVTTFPLIVYYVPLHEAHIQMAFFPRTPKWDSRNCQS
jgi:hypothetical protein